MAVREQAATGMTDGRANALTVVLPLSWWGQRWLQVWFRLLRTRRGRRFAFESSLDPLRFISAIRWSLLPPFDEPDRRIWRRTPDQRTQLLFESNFDGDWDEYLDNFGAVMPRPLESIIAAGVGYPGLGIRGLFKSYTKAHDIMPEHYVSAYRSLAAGDIRQELFALDESGADRRRIVADGFGATEPQWTTFLLPIKLGRTGDVVAAARRFEPPTRPGDDRPVGDDRSPLLAGGNVHFGRVVVVDRPDRSWLLITLTHDGAIEPIVHSLIAREPVAGQRRAPKQPTRSRWRALLEATEGAPDDSTDWWDDERIVEHLLGHRPTEAEHRLTYCAYPGITAARIRGFMGGGARLDRWPAPEVAS